MKPDDLTTPEARALMRAARYGAAFRDAGHPVHPSASLEDLRRAFRIPLPETGAEPSEVIDALIAAAEPGLVGNTDGRFFAWVMGGSNLTGVAADWLTSVWGQNSGIYQTAPASAVAEEAVADWLLELLDLPREASVGFTTGATMAAFTGLAAARRHVLERAGWDIDAQGLQGAPLVRVFLSDDTHVTNFGALRYLGFGEANYIRIPADDQGLMPVAELERALAGAEGPKIVVAQAGHINSGGFDDFEALAALAREHGAWLHVDGAFGLWLRTQPEAAALTRGIEKADSWSVDGHKWLQIPYDSGFAIVRNAEAHRRAMAMQASYIRHDATDGRAPSAYAPELSRRARGFAAWATLRGLGRAGVREMVARHCALARDVAERLAEVPGVRVLNRVDANQVIFTLEGRDAAAVEALTARMNATGEYFLRTADWKGFRCIRISVISGATQAGHLAGFAARLGTEIDALG